MAWREYTLEELQEISDAVGDRSGWDFSRMATEREPVPWDYDDIAARYLKPTDHVLDVGTGGGERLLALSPFYKSAIGVDPDPTMLEAARENGRQYPQVSFSIMGAEQLDFGDEMFDVVLTRHAPTVVAEVNRVIKPGGLFLCQGVGANNMANIRQAFGTGSGTRYEDEYQQLVANLRERSWRILVTGNYDVGYWVKNLPSLLFWFKAIAGANEVPADYSIALHGHTVNRLTTHFATAGGFATNEHRTLLVARKFL